MPTVTEPHITPACMFCGRTSIVEPTRGEADALRAGALIPITAATRPAPERELIRTGIHPAWLDGAFGPVDDDD